MRHTITQSFTVLLLAGCASQPPLAIIEAHRAYSGIAVMSNSTQSFGRNVHTSKIVRAPFKYEKYNAHDYRPMTEGESGNCARFAASYQTRLKASGIESKRMVCVTDYNGPHAFVVAGEWVLDNRFIAPVHIEDVGCIGTMWEGK